jgi:diguanylate cyclase
MQMKRTDDQLMVTKTTDMNVIILDSEERIIGMNAPAQLHTDTNFDEMKNCKFDEVFKLLQAETNEPINNLWKDAAKNQYVSLPVHTLLAVNNKIINIAGFIMSLQCSIKQTNGILFIFTDVENQKKSIDLLDYSIDFHKSLFDNMIEGCQIIGCDWRYIYINDAAVKHSKKSREELLNKTMMELYEGIEYTTMFYLVRDCMENKKPHDIDNQFIYPDGSRNWYQLRIRPVPEGVFILSLDIDERKKLENQILENDIYTRSLLGVIPDMIFLCNSQGFFIDVITSHEEMLFAPKKELIGKNISDIFPQQEADIFFRHINDTINKNNLQTIEYSLTTPVGESWFEARTVPLGKDNTLSLIIDITDRKHKDEYLYIEKEYFKTTLLSVGDGVISVDNKGNVLIINRASEHLTGWKQSDAIGKPIDDVLNMYCESTKVKYINPVYNVIKKGESCKPNNHILLLSKDNIEKSVELGASPIKDAKGNINGAVIVFRDITEKRNHLAEIEYISFHDKLTGLYNRRFFDEEVRRLNKLRNLPLSIIIGDVNGLKKVNDSFGHIMGDEVLKATAKILKDTCRTDDIIARIGGDEFVILLPKTSNEAAQILCTRINSISQTWKVGPIYLSVSLACATKEESTQPFSNIYKNAEDKLYQIKLLNLKSSRSDTVSSLSKALYEMNYETEEHEKRMLEMVSDIGRALDLMPQEIEELKLLAILHDIGKLGISKEIILKPSQLTSDEWVEMKRHSEIGYRIAESTPGLSHISKYILSVHERWDGKGYPQGLKGNATPKLSRIISIVDAYDTMVSGRPYKKPMTHNEAVKEIKRCSGTQFDPLLVDLFLNLCTSNLYK